MDTETCCEGSSFKVESLVTIDERGQMVLPKDLRDRLKLRPGDKMAVISWERNGEVCCLSLVKTENFKGMLANLLGPMVKEMMEAK